MSDGVVIPLDVDDTRARGKVARLKRDAAEAGREYGRAGSQAARIGGVAGGALGRSLGGFAQGGTSGLVGLGLTATGLGLNAFLQRNNERMAEASAREGRVQSREAIQRNVMERTEARAAAGVRWIGSARRVLSRGTPQKDVQASLDMGTSFGLSTAESLGAMDTAERTGQDKMDIMVGLSTGLLGDDVDQVASSIHKFNGLYNAIAASNNIQPQQAAEMVLKSLQDPRAKNIARAGAGMNVVSEDQLSSLMTGKTADAVARVANDEMNPGAKLMAEASRVLLDNVRNLQAAANAENTLAGILKEMGRVVGLSEGSASRALNVGADAASESSGP